MESSQKKSDPLNCDLYWNIVDGVYAGDYRVKLWFRDGSIKIVDLEKRLFQEKPGNVFLPLRDKDYFAEVMLSEEIGTIVWANGADFAPEYLYENGKDVSEA